MPRRKKYENLQGGSRNKRGVYSRPEESEKTVLHREGSDEDYEGEKFSDYKSVKEARERKKKAKKAKSKRFGGLISRLIEGS